MRLSEILTDRQIWSPFSARDKNKALEMMIDRLVQIGKITKDQRRPFLDALLAREKIASTAMGHGVALPHAAVDGLQEAAALFCISKEGVPFQSSDGQPVKLLVLLLLPRQDRQKHIQTLAAVAHLLDEDETRQKLLNASATADVMNVIRGKETPPAHSAN